ncbi:glycoside hydrolase family 16 protein [Pluteus cervinus]|uniref:Glycoside hydrolase family 16 protein n=1 Tax=Pluteus cervinus TaxID=181527 RepID=A0ACD3BGW4_9AGAR|nr:glycoside hydrolase family 16 protein [Pluteus cervinus]
MNSNLLRYLLVLLACHAVPGSAFFQSPSLFSRSSHRPSAIVHERRNLLNTNADGTPFLWLPQDEYSGTTFFDRFQFYTDSDPTKGTVTYVNATTAFASRLAYFGDDGTVFMQGDNTTWLPQGTNRNSVRITSNTVYNTGLFILDLNKAPWGCAVWPAFWTLGTGDWPTNGEIDVLEGVHDNEHNQVAFHTLDGCYLTPTVNISGQVVGTNCDANINDNAGCAVTDWSRASYGPYFESQGGGVFAMKWDENGISVWSFFRAAIPQDIISGSPDPSKWGIPSAALDPAGCDIGKYFANHSIIFDITFCGDWAGNSYATTPSCPGTCPERLMDPNNFVNATWSINSLKVYRKQLLIGKITNGSPITQLDWVMLSTWILVGVTTLATLY